MVVWGLNLMQHGIWLRWLESYSVVDDLKTQLREYNTQHNHLYRAQLVNRNVIPFLDWKRLTPESAYLNYAQIDP